MTKELTPLSASRIKTLENCSWMYYCKYILKIPDTKNDGATKGTICHSIFENLLSKDRRDYVKKIINCESLSACPSIARLARFYIKKEKLSSPTEAYNHIESMVLVGLKNDFFVEGGKLVSAEYEFDITNENPKFRIKGYIDKLFIKDNTIYIDDFKSSKAKFTGDEQESNLQALVYSYATKKIWPDLKPLVRFIFLQFPKNPIESLNFSDDALLGLQYYLSSIQERIDGFNENASRNNFAHDKYYPSSEGFKGKLLCGFATKPGQLKKDGTKMWACPYKFKSTYYGLIEKDKIVKSSFDKDELIPNTSQKIVELKYDGCPRHINPLDDFPNKAINKKPCILDDF